MNINIRWAAILVLLLGLIGYNFGFFGNAARSLNSCTDLEFALMQMANRPDATDLKQQLQACLGEDVTPSGDDQPKDEDPVVVDGMTPYTKEYLVPRADKVGANSYGPRTTIFVNRGTELEDLGASDFFAELKQRMPYSPVLTASLGASRGVWPWDVANDKVKTFLEDTAEWKQAVKDVSAKLNADLQEGVTDDIKPAGLYDATYSYIGPDGTPVIRRNEPKKPVKRTTPFAVVVFKDGTILRKGCSGQEYWDRQQPAKKAPAKLKALKPVSPGIVRDEEDVPKRESPKPESPAPEQPKPESPAPEQPKPSESPKPSEPPQPSTEAKDPRDDINVNPSIPPQERVDPIQSAPPEQGQPTKPPEAPTTPRVDPAPPAQEPRDDPQPPPSEDGGGDNAGAPTGA